MSADGCTVLVCPSLEIDFVQHLQCILGQKAEEINCLHKQFLVGCRVSVSVQSCKHGSMNSSVSMTAILLNPCTSCCKGQMELYAVIRSLGT